MGRGECCNSFRQFAAAGKEVDEAPFRRKQMPDGPREEYVYYASRTVEKEGICASRTQPKGRKPGTLNH